MLEIGNEISIIPSGPSGNESFYRSSKTSLVLEMLQSGNTQESDGSDATAEDKTL